MVVLRTIGNNIERSFGWNQAKLSDSSKDAVTRCLIDLVAVWIDVRRA